MLGTSACSLAAGQKNLILMALPGFLGAAVGDNIGYLVGRLGGGWSPGSAATSCSRSAAWPCVTGPSATTLL
jgi:membrane protein DedA with SNARE-associated domain